VPIGPKQKGVISKGVGNGDKIGLEGAMYFADKGVIGIDFFRVKDTGKRLLILIKVDGGVVFIKREPFPLAEDGELL
jgi:hypothetical protein